MLQTLKCRAILLLMMLIMLIDKSLLMRADKKVTVNRSDDQR